MNLYFWVFSLCALWMMPLSISFSFFADREVRHELKIRMAGFTFPREMNDEAEERPEKKARLRSLLIPDLPMALKLLRRGVFRRVRHAMQLESIHLNVRISAADAACTAMSYAALRTLFQTLLACVPQAVHLHGGVKMDFQGKGNRLFVQCIFSARLGNLTAAVLYLMFAVIRERAERLKTEEESYAAASH